MANDRYPPHHLVLRWNMGGRLHSVSIDYREFCRIAGRLLTPYLKDSVDVGFFSGVVHDGMCGDRASQFVSNLLAEAAVEAHECAEAEQPDPSV